METILDSPILPERSEADHFNLSLSTSWTPHVDGEIWIRPRRDIGHALVIPSPAWGINSWRVLSPPPLVSRAYSAYRLANNAGPILPEGSEADHLDLSQSTPWTPRVDGEIRIRPRRDTGHALGIPSPAWGTNSWRVLSLPPLASRAYVSPLDVNDYGFGSTGLVKHSMRPQRDVAVNDAGSSWLRLMAGVVCGEDEQNSCFSSVDGASSFEKFKRKSLLKGNSCSSPTVSTRATQAGPETVETEATLAQQTAPKAIATPIGRRIHCDEAFAAVRPCPSVRCVAAPAQTISHLDHSQRGVCPSGAVSRVLGTLHGFSHQCPTNVPRAGAPAIVLDLHSSPGRGRPFLAKRSAGDRIGDVCSAASLRSLSQSSGSTNSSVPCLHGPVHASVSRMSASPRASSPIAWPARPFCVAPVGSRTTSRTSSPTPLRGRLALHQQRQIEMSANQWSVTAKPYGTTVRTRFVR
jgi:hypothetical protein